MKNKKMMKRFLTLTLVAGMFATVLTGCGSKSKESQVSSEELKAAYASGEFDARAVTEGVTLTIAIPSNSRVSDYETNDTTLMIEEALGVDLKFMVLPSADYASKLNVMVMSGDDLPDIIFDPSGYANWIEEGAIVELSEFYADENCSANIRAGSERAELDLIKYMTRAEGTIYTLPKMNQEIYAPVKQKLWIYQPWLDKLGLDVPETTEEYYNACKLVVENDMNSNGKKDEIGLTGTNLDEWFDCMMSAFVYAHEESWRVVEDGKVSFAFTTDEWKDGLKYIRKFFEEDLIPEETLTQASSQYDSLYYSSTPVLFSFADWNYTGTDTNRRSEYSVLPALKGPDGVQYSCNIPVLPEAGAVITTDCENPLAAFLVCDYMCSMDLSLTQRFGKQGLDWDYWDVAQTKFGNPGEFVPTFEGYDIAFYPYDLMGYWNGTAAQNSSYRQTGPMILDKTLTAGAGVWVGASDDTTRTLAEIELTTAAAAEACYEYQPEEVYDYAPLTIEETDDVADIKTALIDYVTEMTGSFLIGEKDIDKEWDSYLAELENIGIDEYLKVLQKAYDRTH